MVEVVNSWGKAEGGWEMLEKDRGGCEDAVRGWERLEDA